MASADVEDGAAVSMSKFTSKVSKGSVDDPCEGQSGRVTKNFWKVLESQSLSYEGYGWCL